MNEELRKLQERQRSKPVTPAKQKAALPEQKATLPDQKEAALLRKEDEKQEQLEQSKKQQSKKEQRGKEQQKRQEQKKERKATHTTAAPKSIPPEIALLQSFEVLHARSVSGGPLRRNDRVQIIKQDVRHGQIGTIAREQDAKDQFAVVIADNVKGKTIPFLRSKSGKKSTFASIFRMALLSGESPQKAGRRSGCSH